MSKVQNGVEHVHVSESPKPVTNSGGGGFYDNARKESVQSLPPPTPVEEIMVKSPSGVRNMQESTLDKERKSLLIVHLIYLFVTAMRCTFCFSVVDLFCWLCLCTHLHFILPLFVIS